MLDAFCDNVTIKSVKNHFEPFMMEIAKNSLHKRTYNYYTRKRTPHCHNESEKTLELRLRKEVEARGGMALKLLSQLHRGLPDRLILMPGGKAFFAELKSTGKKPTKLQQRAHEQLAALGFQVFVIDSTSSLTRALAEIDRMCEL